MNSELELPSGNKVAQGELVSMRHGCVAWCLGVVPALAIAISALALTPTPGTGQSLAFSPRVSVMGGDETAASYGLRAEVGVPWLAVFGQGGWFGVYYNCDLISSCNSPSGGLELLGGARLSLPQLGPVRPAISLGAGHMIWDVRGSESGTGSIWEAELRLGIRAFSWADLLLGATVKSVGQSVSGGTTRLTRDRGTYKGIVVGLLIPVL